MESEPEAGERGDAALPRIVLADANVLFPARLRDIFMHLSLHEVIHLAWTKEIEAEWVRNVIQKHNADAEKLNLCASLMCEAVPGWEVAGYEHLHDQFPDVDAKDKHVAAAASHLSATVWEGESVALVTQNLADLPQRAFTGTAVQVYSPDDYLCSLLEVSRANILEVLEVSRMKLSAPPRTHSQFAQAIDRCGCPNLARLLAVVWKGR